MKKNIYLITGATGFLGSNICMQLLEHGEKVRAFAIPDDPAIKFLSKEIEVITGDLCDNDSLEKFFKVPDDYSTIVIHTASIVTLDPHFNRTLLNVNVGGTINIIKKCIEHKECKKLVYVSSTGAIPEKKSGIKIKEIYDFNAKEVIGWYSKTKAIATKKVLNAVKNKNLDACIVFPSGILGPNDKAFSKTTKTIADIVNGKIPIVLQGSFNLCDVRDLAYGCISAAEKGKRGECYILANEEVTYKELCKMLDKYTGKKHLRIFLPMRLAKIFAALIEIISKITNKKPILTTFTLYNLERNNSFDYSKAKEELGYRTRPYTSTIKDEVLWLKKEGKICEKK